LGIETEVKIKINDPDGFCSQLSALNPRVLSTRHFEDNHLLDFPDGSLKSSRCLVRIRYAKGASFITYKGPPRAEGIFKVREELETKLEDGSIVLSILEKLGMRVWFRYQKYRREFIVDEIHVAVDETPVGDYAEFEGPEEGIRHLARRLGVAESQFLRFSYYALYLEYCQKRGDDPTQMIFNSKSEIGNSI
jgi:adenylate cyclase class 2